MLTVKQYREIKQVKDSSPFTCSIPLKQYIEGVRYRLSQWYGIDEEKISDEQVYYFLSKSRIIK